MIIAMLLAALTNPGGVDVLDPEVLAALEQDRFGFRALTGNAWDEIAPVLEKDLADFEKAIEGTRDDTHRFVIRELATSSAGAYQIESNGDAPRQLDARWLRSPLSTVKLVAVVPRFDRRDFDPQSPCGEVRFIYRLAYKTKEVRSSLPFFVNVVTRPRCEGYFEGYGDDVAKWLRSRPLSLKQIEVNFQSLRFSAGYMTDFGGQALYIMRIFRKDDAGRFSPVALENTPDVNAIRADPALRQRFLAFLKKPENLAKLDEGTLVIPDFDGKFLARIAVSWSTLGRARLGNKPYRDLFSDNDLAGLQGKYAKSAAGILERLDNLTCMGCHQSGGTAGFHILGAADDRVSDAYNQTEVAFSPHYAAERVRRAKVIEAARRGAPVPTFRPHSFFPMNEKARHKEACLVDDKDFAGGLRCDEGLRCERTVSNAMFGECVTPEPIVAGSVCQTGSVKKAKRPVTSLPASTFDFLDGFIPEKPLYDLPAKHTKTQQGCRPPSIGVPLGRTFRLCSDAERRLDDVAAWMKGGPEPTQLCAAVGGSKFEECAKGDNVLLCLAGAVTRGMVDSCSPTRFCREDYICQRLPKPLPGVSDEERIDALHRAHIGFCTPTYFLFNMRADGHPDPMTGAASALSKEKRAKEYRGGYR